MGTDIQGVVEIFRDDRWYYAELFNCPQDYEFFGVLAGVREPCDNPIAKDRGIPEDSGIKVDVGIGCGHSWVLLEELFRDHRPTRTFAKDYLRSVGVLYQLMGYDPSRVRVVFWFDS